MSTQLSAVIPTHNRPEELARAVASIESQTAPTQIVVVDDGSDPPVDTATLPANSVLIRHETATGPSIARNRGATAAPTEWIGFLDDDDMWLPTKTREVLRVASAYPDAGVIFNRTGWSPSTTDGGVNYLNDPLQRVLRRQPPHISGVAVRKSIHEDVRFDETMWATQDIDYLIRLAQKTQWVEIRRYLSSHGDTGPDGSAIDVESRIAGRLSLLDKHGDLIMRDPVAHSFFLARLGHQYRRAGRYKEARSSFLGALRIRPVCGVAWRGLIRVSIPPLRDA